MRDLSDQDWDLLNAYHDGELPVDAQRALEARLEREPTLAEALQRLELLTEGLKALHPLDPLGVEQPVVANENRAPWRWMAAACLAAVVCLGVFFGRADLTPLDVHRDLAAQPHDVVFEDLMLAQTSGSLMAPDLRAANLVAVLVRPHQDGTVAHYTGRNNCRLSYFRVRDPQEFRAEPGGRIAVWETADGWAHSIIATGMDLDRFNAAKAYLVAVTRAQESQAVYAALEQATQSAKPCVV